MTTLELQNEILRRIGITPKGASGCVACDNVGYLQCRCPNQSSGGGGGGGFSEGGSTNKQSGDNEPTKVPKKQAESTAEKRSQSVDFRMHDYMKIPVLQFSRKLTVGLPDALLAKLTKEELQELQKILVLLQGEFAEFIKGLEKNGANISNYLAVIRNHTLELTIRNPAHYDLFIAHLLKKNLLSQSPVNDNVNDETAENKVNFVPSTAVKNLQTKTSDLATVTKPEQFRPSPFRTKLVPKGYKQ
jgi:hypothetical protein